MKLLSLLVQNKHTSIAAVLYVLAKMGAQLGGVWFPEHKSQFESTATIIESGAVTYGLFAAGDAARSARAEPGEPKASTPTPPESSSGQPPETKAP